MNLSTLKNAKASLVAVIACVVASILIFFGNSYQLHAASTQAGEGSTANGGAAITLDESVDSVTVNPNGQLNFYGKLQQDTTDTGAGAINNIIVKYRLFISGVAGLAAVSMLLFFIIHLGKLGATAANSRARSEVIMGLVWSAIATAGLGAVAVIVGFFYRIFL